MIHKDTKRGVLLCNKVSFCVRKGKGICQSYFLLSTCHEKISRYVLIPKMYTSQKKYIFNKFILNLLVIQRIKSICELVLDIEEGRRTILWFPAVWFWSAGPSESVSMRILSVVLQFLGSEFVLRSVVHGKWVAPPDCRNWANRWVQVFVVDVTYSSCAGVVCV